ncbi:uncharacterized protein LOC128155785 [Crassostrea angulata]|uniref:uncharacterized protein LOC128155785 n=1 Tax=Magallana angulata TaxID=2784310 RepID=UPI0022B0CD06|nr:uncharacterized protein LOC128155785 [Crassostrea angulata]
MASIYYNILKMRLGSLSVVTGILVAVSGEECIEQQTTEENVTTIVSSLRTRTKAVKKGRRYRMETEYYEFFEEKISRRNVTHSVATCCHGYENVNGKCLKHSTFVTPNAPISASMTSVVVPTVMLLFMLAVSIVVVYHLHSKDKLCTRSKRKNKTKKSSVKKANRSTDELYTQIEPPTGIVSGHYDDLRCSQRQVNANPQPNKGTEEDDRRSDHNYDYLSISSTLTK